MRNEKQEPFHSFDRAELSSRCGEQARPFQLFNAEARVRPTETRSLSTPPAKQKPLQSQQNTLAMRQEHLSVQTRAFGMLLSQRQPQLILLSFSCLKLFFRENRFSVFPHHQTVPGQGLSHILVGKGSERGCIGSVHIFLVESAI